MPKKTKTVSKFIQDELKLAEWKEIGTEGLDGYVWRKDGIQILVVPASMNKMYYLTWTKMSESWTKFVTEEVLLELTTN